MDSSKTLLFIALMLFIVMLVSNGKRVTASTPIPGSDTVGESQTSDDQSDLTPAWAANVPTLHPAPLSLMMPNTGAQSL